MKYLFKSCAHILWVVGFVIIMSGKFLYFLDTTALWHVCFANIFSMACLHLLQCPWRINSLILMTSYWSICSFVAHVFGVISRKSLPHPSSQFSWRSCIAFGIMLSWFITLIYPYGCSISCCEKGSEILDYICRFAYFHCNSISCFVYFEALLLDAYWGLLCLIDELIPLSLPNDLL